jgi:hypothetical protein
VEVEEEAAAAAVVVVVVRQLQTLLCICYLTIFQSPGSTFRISITKWRQYVGRTMLAPCLFNPREVW